MTTRMATWMTALTATALLALPGRVAAQHPTLVDGGAASRAVAFHGTYRGAITLVNGIGERYGTGSASQLGQGVLRSLDATSHYGGAGVGAAEGEGTLTAKGGSVLQYAYVTEFHIDNKTPAPGYYVFEGGTGRFSGASGTGTLRETPSGLPPAHPSPNDKVQVTLTFSGTLNLVP